MKNLAGGARRGGLVALGLGAAAGGGGACGDQVSTMASRMVSIPHLAAGSLSPGFNLVKEAQVGVRATLRLRRNIVQIGLLIPNHLGFLCFLLANHLWLRLRLRLRPPWLLLKSSLGVRRLLLPPSAAAACCWELFGKQRVSSRLLLVLVLVQTGVLLSVLVEPVVVALLSVLVELVVVVLLSVLIELVVVLLSVLVELIVVLLSVLVELVVVVLLSVLVELVVLVESLLLSVVILRKLLTVVLLAIILLAIILLAVVLLLFTVTQGANVDVPSKTWNVLSPAIASNGLRYCHDIH